MAKSSGKRPKRLQESPIHRRLRCPACSFAAECGPAEMLRWLQRAGLMRRAKEPDEAMIAELFAQTAARFSCPQCGRAGLTVEDAVDDGSDEDWGMARRCAGCGRPIAPERLEIFPTATHCAACQSSAESADADEPDYCPRCGSIMTLRATRAGGVQRYAMTCPQCGRGG